MKKLLSLALALVLALSMSTVAFAANVTYEASDGTSFVITKTYVSDENYVPGETLNFTITADTNNPVATPMISIGENNSYTVSTDTNAKPITVTVPSYSQAGVYKYTIQEQTGETAGVTYDTEKTIEVAVLVEYDNENHKLVIGNTQYIVKNAEGEKVSTFENSFDTADFTVEKDVIGNMSNENDAFPVVVTLTSEEDILTAINVGGETIMPDEWLDGTYTKELFISESRDKVTFANIPVGVEVEVKETDAGEYTLKGYATAKADNGVYGDGALNNSMSFTVSDDTANTTVVVVNDRTVGVDTGISLDSAPYILMLAVAVIGCVVLVSKKRA